LSLARPTSPLSILSLPSTWTSTTNATKMNSVGARVFSCRYMTYKNFYLLPNLKKKVISGLIFVAIIVGFGLFLYYNGGGSDQVLALVAERTFDQVCYLMCRRITENFLDRAMACFSCLSFCCRGTRWSSCLASYLSRGRIYPCDEAKTSRSSQYIGPIFHAYIFLNQFQKGQHIC